MARQRGLDQKIQVTKGFVTEFTPVAFPQEAAIDLDNVVIDADGSVRRRPGIDLEQQFALNTIAGGVLTASEIEDIGLSNHLWESVGNSGTLNIVVFQIGLELQFYAQVGVLSKQLLGTIDLTIFAVNVAKLKLAKVQVASGLGDLYVVSEFMEPIRIAYDGTAFTATKINIRIRDFEGLDDELAIDERPTVLKRNHYYNLVNQGWTDVNIRLFAGLGTGVNLCLGTGGVGGLAAAGGKNFPSNADQMIVGIVTDSSGNLEFDPEFIKEGFTGNTPAPKGHFILDAFNQDFDEALDCSGTGSRVFANRPEAVAFHQGRAFYTTPNTQGRVGGVFYSQQLVVADKDGNAFQEADPTADQINDLIETDGGFLPMPGVGEIYRLLEVSTGIACVASNGVWFITGADGNGLSATNIRLDHSSTIGALSASSVVQAEGSIFYFGIDGIIQGSIDEIGRLQMTNITQKVIQTFYINISAAARRDAAVVYLPEQRKIYWAYRDAPAAEGTTSRSFNKFLILDFDIGGFYKYSIKQQVGTVFPEIVGLSFVKPLVEGTDTESVTETDGTVVTDIAGDIVTVNRVQDLGQITQLKMATLAFSTVDNGYKATFATFHSRAFVDWKDVDSVGEGVPMTSFIEFAEFNMGAVHTKGKITHVHSFYQKTSKNLEPGGYYELPPLFYVSTGVRISQSVLEILNRPSSNMRVSQSVMELLMTAPSDYHVSQSIIEVLDRVTYASSGSPEFQGTVRQFGITGSNRSTSTLVRNPYGPPYIWGKITFLEALPDMSSLTLVPAPFYANGEWWAYHNTEDGTNQQLRSLVAPNKLTLLRASNAAGTAYDVELQDDTGNATGFGMKIINGTEMVASSVTTSWDRIVDVDTSTVVTVESANNLPDKTIVGGVTFMSFLEEDNKWLIMKTGLAHSTGRPLLQELHTSSTAKATDFVSHPANAKTTLLNVGVLGYAIQLNGFTYIIADINYAEDEVPGLASAFQGSARTIGRAAYKSTDLINWTLVKFPDGRIKPWLYFNGYYYSQHTLVEDDRPIDAFSTKFGPTYGAHPSIWRSSDLENWTELTVPDDVGNEIFMGHVTSNRITFISQNSIYYSTDGTTFVREDFSHNLFAFRELHGSRSMAGMNGSIPRPTRAQAPPPFILARTSNAIEHGGKILNMGEDFNATPTLHLPATHTYGATVGFLGLGVDNDLGISGNGFDIKHQSGEGFYLHNTGKRYFEITIKELTGPLHVRFGLVTLAGNYRIAFNKRVGFLFTGNSFGTLLLERTEVMTRKALIPPEDALTARKVSNTGYVMSVNDVLGFVVDFATGTTEIYVNNVLEYTVTDMDTTQKWTQRVDATQGKINMNIGQDAFIYTKAGTVAWNS